MGGFTVHEFCFNIIFFTDVSTGKKISSVLWSFHIFASPNPQHIWINPKDKEIHQLDRFKIENPKNDETYTLTIDNVEYTDMGHYTFIIKVDNDNPGLHPNKIDEKEIDLYLKVIKVPKVMFMNPRRRLLHKYYIANQKHDLKFRINGFKIDRSSLQWSFR